MANFTFICGDDDFLVTREAKARYEHAAAPLSDDFSREIIDGAAQNAGEVATAIARFRAAVQTRSLFGEKKAVWLREVTFLADSRTGKAEETKNQLAALQETLETIDPDSAEVIISACPVDRRRKEFKWLQKNARFEDLKGAGTGEALAAMADEEAARLGITFAPGALEALNGTVNGNTRLVLEETRKLAAYLGEDGGEVTPQLVAELVPTFGEGDFFETTEAFFSLDLERTLDALRRHFFVHKEGRPVIASLQSRNRLMIQIRALLDSGEVRPGPRGISKGDFESAWRAYGRCFGGERENKTPFNVFTQNLWYLGNRLAPTAGQLTMRRLIGFQAEFLRAFEGILDRPDEQEGVLRAMAIRCLG